jgi:hypothetical protein
MGALEKTIRSYPEKREEHVAEPSIGMTFDSLGEAYHFYNLYSWEHGFGVRYGKSRLNPEKTKTMHEIVCGCSVSSISENVLFSPTGNLKTTNAIVNKVYCGIQQLVVYFTLSYTLQGNRSCHCECPAMIRLLRTKDNCWYITEQRVVAHNHSIPVTCGEKVYWPSHKHIDAYTKDLVRQLRENNINITKVYSIIGSFFGGVGNVPFTKRTLKNLCGQISKDQADDDMKKTIELFAEIGSTDKELIPTAES